MSKRKCYFKCKYDGLLYNFPPVTYNSYEKYCKWKDVLRKEDQTKGKRFIAHKVKLCNNHFEKYYITANKRLTRHAVPTLNLGITVQQEELLCKFIEQNPKVIVSDLHDQDLEKDKWTNIGPQLNTLGPEKTYSAWAEYVSEIKSSLETKKNIWKQEGEMQLVNNTDNFTKLELKILQLCRNETMEVASPDRSESQDRSGSDNGEDNEIDIEYIIEDSDSDHSRDSEINRVNCTNEVSGCGDSGTVTFTLNESTGGHEPLLQAANIAPYEAPQEYTNANCKCKYPNSEVEDEFEAFGKDIAQQLRGMPKETALETQKLLRSVLRSKQSKVINDLFIQYIWIFSLFYFLFLNIRSVIRTFIFLNC